MVKLLFQICTVYGNMVVRIGARTKLKSVMLEWKMNPSFRTTRLRLSNYGIGSGFMLQHNFGVGDQNILKPLQALPNNIDFKLMFRHY